MVPYINLATPFLSEGLPDSASRSAPHPSSLRVNTGGNFCGHDPQNPAFLDLIPKHKGKGSMPRVLSKLCESVSKLYDDPDLLPSFSRSLLRLRRMRTEQRDACMSLLMVILNNTDLRTLRIGNPRHHSGFLSYTVAYLSKKAGLDIRRGQRAMRCLVDAGIVTVYQQRSMSENGKYRSQAALKSINRAIFRVFGLERMYQHYLDYVEKKDKKDSRKKQGSTESWYNAQQADRSRAAFEFILPKIARSMKDRKKSTHSPPGLTPSQEARYREAQIEIALQNPQISPTELKALALKKSKR
jgi:hypothetical protein